MGFVILKERIVSWYTFDLYFNISYNLYMIFP